MQQKMENVRLLKTIKKTRVPWVNEKENAKIIRKLENNKNLKRREFSQIYWALWERGRH